MPDRKVRIIKNHGEPYVKIDDLIQLMNEVIIDDKRPTEEKRLAIELKSDFVTIRQN